MKHALNITLDIVAETASFVALPLLAGRMVALAVLGFVAATWLGMGLALLPLALLAWGVCYATIRILYGSAAGFLIDLSSANPSATLRLRRDMTRQNRRRYLKDLRKTAWQFR